VGIGTNTPKSKLDVKGSLTVGATYAGVNAAPTNGAIIEGNVGIGTSTPKAKLEIGGFPALNTTYTFLNNSDSFDKSILLNIGTLRETAPTNTNGARLLTFYDVPPSNISPNAQTLLAIEDRNDSNRLRHNAVANGNSLFSLNDKTQTSVLELYEDGTNAFLTLPKPDSYFTIGGTQVWPVPHRFEVKNGSSKFGGNVYVDTNLGIGTSNFIDGTDTFRLSVKGAIRADRVKVYTTWADFVFEKNYKLPTLEEVEKHITEKGHLKDIPSAKEVEEKGIELGEMNKLLLQKVEELTLYMIEMNKEMQQLKEQIKK
jgi:hypothetical protein